MEMSSKDIKKSKSRNSYDNTNIYIKIDGKNKLEEQSDDLMSQLLMESVNSIQVENIGKEINKFFVKILPENKEGDILKFNYALATKIKKKFNLNKIETKSKCEEYLNAIINMKIDPNVPLALTRDINEKLSFVLMVIFKHIKKKGKFSDYEDVKQCVSKLANSQNGILDSLQNKNDSNPYSYMYSNDSYIDDNDLYESENKVKTNEFFDNKIEVEPLRMSHAVQFKRNEIMNINNNMYNYKGQQLKKENKIPQEVFILREKFENIKIIKLSLKNHNSINNELILLDQNDIMYNIFVLINLKLIFQNLMGIELDLSNEIILKDEILDINAKFEKVLKQTKKNRKMTYYKSENKTRIYDVYKNKILLSSYNRNTTTEDIESSDNFSSFALISNNEQSKKQQEKFLNKHMYSLQMIVIYWYFITLLNDIKICNFTLPINFEEKILLMLKESKIILFDFNIFNNMSSKLTEVTIDFNSLENKLFQQIISFLFVNTQLTKCNLSLFPPEEYFEPRHLFNLLIQSSKSKFYKSEIKPGEEIDIFILRKMSEFFENNINKLFCYFYQMTKIKEISLIFDIPSVMNKVSNYEMIILKFIINIFLLIKSRNTFRNITIISDNLNFDNRKHPFLTEFLENMDLFNKKKSKIESLTLKFRIYEIHNLYRIIPYNVNHLSLGSFDLPSFKYFVEYITSSEYCVHSQIQYLQITLSNTIITLDEECYNALEKLLIYYPKNLEEIRINTSIYANKEQIENLIKKTNYNKISKISFFLNLTNNDENNDNNENNENKMFVTPKKNKLNAEKSNENGLDLYYIQKEKDYETFKNYILNMMYKVGKKYNKDFMDFNIFSQLEKFLFNKGKKKVIIQ